MKPDHRPPKSQTPSIAFPTEDCKNCQGVALKSQRRQLALRISVSPTSVVTPGAGCSITSEATVSTTGATGCFTFRAAFFTGAGLGLALATVRFVALALADLVALRALPRVAEFRFCTFDPFLRLAMIAPLWLVPVTSYPHDFVGQRTNGQVSSTYPPGGRYSHTLCSLKRGEGPWGKYASLVVLGSPLFFLSGRMGTRGRFDSPNAVREHGT
jgi:hypothetical protein